MERVGNADDRFLSGIECVYNDAPLIERQRVHVQLMGLCVLRKFAMLT